MRRRARARTTQAKAQLSFYAGRPRSSACFFLPGVRQKCGYNADMLSLATLDQLRTDTGVAALGAARALEPSPATLLRDLETLRKLFPPELASAALETVMLRQRARAKFSRADEMFFTREALEQASGERVACHRAERFTADDAPVYDACCSIGGDALGLALAGIPVRGIDIDPVRVALAEANLAVYGVAQLAELRVADATMLELPKGATVFFDPARRGADGRGGRHAGKRVWRPEEYQPPLSLIDRWLPRVAGLAVKVAPGIDYDALPYHCEVELVSVAGEVKEACLWFGRFQRHRRSATVLPASGPPATIHAAEGMTVPVVEPLRFLYEPDGAVIRAHLVEELARQIDAAKIDDEIAFLTADSLQATPFARAFAVREVLPFNLKRLRSRLRELEIGRVVVKKRGSPIDPQVLEQQLRLPRELPHATTLVLTRVRGQPSVILCDPA